MARSLAALAVLLLLSASAIVVVSASPDNEPSTTGKLTHHGGHHPGRRSTIPLGLFNFKALANAEMDPGRFNGTRLNNVRPSASNGGVGEVIQHLQSPTGNVSDSNMANRPEEAAKMNPKGASARSLLTINTVDAPAPAPSSAVTIRAATVAVGAMAVVATSFVL